MTTARSSKPVFNSYLSLFLVVMIVVVSVPVTAGAVLVALTLPPQLSSLLMAIVESSQS